MKRNVVND